MNIRTDINPPSFKFDRSYYEAASMMTNEERLRFYDGLCAFAFERQMPAMGQGDESPLSIAFTLAVPGIEASVVGTACGKLGGRPRKA